MLEINRFLTKVAYYIVSQRRWKTWIIEVGYINVVARFVGLVNNDKWQDSKPKREKGLVLSFKHLDFIRHLDFEIWNLLGLALSLSKGDYINLEVKYEDNT